MIFGGETGCCSWTCSYGLRAPGDLDKLILHLVSVRARPGLVLLNFSQTVELLDIAHIRRLAGALKANLANHPEIAGHALITNSLLIRGFMGAIFKLVTTPYPEAAFAKPEMALAWLKERSPDFDAAAVLADIGRSAPGFAALRW